MNFLDLSVFFIYMLGITLIGGMFYRKNKSSSAFTLGNNSIPGWVVTMSIFATFVSSISYLALPGIAYQSNWNSFVFSLSLPIAALVAIKVFVPLYRSVNSVSAYTYFENRFHTRLTIVMGTSAIFLVGFLIGLFNNKKG